MEVGTPLHHVPFELHEPWRRSRAHQHSTSPSEAVPRRLLAETFGAVSSRRAGPLTEDCDGESAAHRSATYDRVPSTKHNHQRASPCPDCSSDGGSNSETEQTQPTTATSFTPLLTPPTPLSPQPRLRFTKSLSIAPGFDFLIRQNPLADTFDFRHVQPASLLQSTTCTKRARPLSDIDGPFTAELACKKRRLRLQLITSRLSQPFSLPATHILNREGMATAGKDSRLASLAAARDLARRGFGRDDTASSFLRRMAAMNRMRMTGQLVMDVGGVGRMALCSDSPEAKNANSPNNNNGIESSTPARDSRPITSRVVGLQHYLLMSGGVRAPMSTMHAGPLPRTLPTPLTAFMARAASSPFRRLAPLRSLSPTPSSMSGLTSPSSSPPQHHPRPPATTTTPPRTRPSTPQEDSPPAFSRDLDDDEYGTAFPTSEHESRYDLTDDPEDVYTDFGAIFGTGQDSEDEIHDQEQGQESYEEYLDELDGISWAVR